MIYLCRNVVPLKHLKLSALAVNNNNFHAAVVLTPAVLRCCDHPVLGNVPLVSNTSVYAHLNPNFAPTSARSSNHQQNTATSTTDYTYTSHVACLRSIDLESTLKFGIFSTVSQAHHQLMALWHKSTVRIGLDDIHSLV
jgi:hypothetical protein